MRGGNDACLRHCYCFKEAQREDALVSNKLQTKLHGLHFLCLIFHPKLSLSLTVRRWLMWDSHKASVQMKQSENITAKAGISPRLFWSDPAFEKFSQICKSAPDRRPGFDQSLEAWRGVPSQSITLKRSKTPPFMILYVVRPLCSQAFTHLCMQAFGGNRYRMQPDEDEDGGGAAEVFLRSFPDVMRDLGFLDPDPLPSHQAGAEEAGSCVSRPRFTPCLIVSFLLESLTWKKSRMEEGQEK